VASAFAIVVTGAMLWQGRDARPLALAAMVAGACVGLVWGLARRPSVFEAAVEADRQLELADLLATALVARATDDAWSGVVVALAEERCRTLSAARVVVHRYGGRAWSGIGLTAALGITLAAMSSVPQEGRARPAAADATRDVASARRADEMPARENAGGATRADRAAPRGARDEASAPMPREVAADVARAPKEGEPRFAHPGDAPDVGASAGETRASSGVSPSPAGEGRPDSSTEALGGGGRSSAALRPTGGPAGSTGGTRASNVAELPWKSATWPADQAAAGQAIHNGRVPAAYQDVVGAYFDRERPSSP
jgi:hypothetical protein